MRIAFNPKSVAPLTAAPTGDYLNAITFDLAGHNIFTRGEMFKGTDTTYEVFRKATQSAVGYNGLVPAPSYTGSSVRFLREDGTWQLLESNSQRPINIDNSNVLLSTDIDKSLNLVAGNNIVLEPQTDVQGNYTGEVIIKTSFQVSGDFTGEISDAFTTVKVGNVTLKASSNKQLIFGAGTGISLTPSTTNNSIQIAAPVFTGATSSADGAIGTVPKPLKANITSYLKGDGTWHTLDTSQIYSLTGYSYGYTLTGDVSNLATTDTLNQALAKLEHKANKGVAAYNWYITVTDENTDEYVNKWQEIVDFLNEVKSSDGDILDQFVTIKTAQTISGAKTFSAATTINNTLAVNNTVTVKGNVNPKTNNTYTLGTTSLQWKNIYSVLGTFSGNVTSDGFVKLNSSDNNILLGGGGHKPISDFMLKSEELENNVTTITKSLTVTQNWMNTGIGGTNIPNTGTYIVQISVNDGNMVECVWSGIMSWYNGTCSDDDTDEILLHRSGKSYSDTLYLRTKMNSSGTLSLQIAANKNIGAEYSYTFKFKQIL